MTTGDRAPHDEWLWDFAVEVMRFYETAFP